MSLEGQLQALRHAAAVSQQDHVACVRLVGEDAFDALDAVCPADLFVRDGQMLHTLLLREDATIFADLYVCSDDEDFVLLAEGPDGAALKAHLEQHLPPGLRPEIVDLSQEHLVLSLHGPYAWEVLAGVAGAEVVGLPYMTFYHDEGFSCFRAGKTGEFGYDLLVPRAGATALRGRIDAAAAALELDLEQVQLEALDQCALENWFFNVRREGSEEVTPLELQLQWRVSYHKDYVGSAALARRREQGASQRLTCATSDAELTVGAQVLHDGTTVGRLVNAGYSPARGDWVGLALLERSAAHVGAVYETLDAAGAVSPLRTVSPPVLDNRSLFIDLQRHSWRTRRDDVFPPVAPGR